MELNVPSLESLLPPEMAQRAEQIGFKKACQSAPNLFVLAVLAGAFVALGALFSTTVTADTSGVLPYGIVRLLGGLVFTLGLILVVVGGAELFTGNNMIVMAWASGKVSLWRLVRNWIIVYAGNFFGSIATAIVVFFSGQYTFGGGTVGAAALATANAKVSLDFVQAIALGILCNALVCLAIWLTYSARTTTDRILAVIPPITAFAAAGFEHSVANMYFIPIALFIRQFAAPTFWTTIAKTGADFPNLTVIQFLIGNLLPVTIGNIIGGSILVSAVYWFVYLRPTQARL